jgi:hypothetical protein
MRAILGQDMAGKTKRRNSRRSARRKKSIVKLPAEYLVAMDLGNVIFPALYQFENGLRLLINDYLGTCYGSNWWDVSLKSKLEKIFQYAENQQVKLDAMPWIGSSSVVKVLPIHLVTLGQLEQVVKAYHSECIPELFPTLDFFTGHMELIKRVRNMYTHTFPCISREDCEVAINEISVLARHVNSKL